MPNTQYSRTSQSSTSASFDSMTSRNPFISEGVAKSPIEVAQAALRRGVAQAVAAEDRIAASPAKAAANAVEAAKGAVTSAQGAITEAKKAALEALETTLLGMPASSSRVQKALIQAEVAVGKKGMGEIGAARQELRRIADTVSSNPADRLNKLADSLGHILTLDASLQMANREYAIAEAHASKTTKGSSFVYLQQFSGRDSKSAVSTARLTV